VIELWFDFSCPYAYLASRRAPELAARLGVPLAWRPMLLGGVFRGIGAGDGPMATLSPVRAAYNLRDMQRWAEHFGDVLRVPPAHPMRTVRALRVLLGLSEASWPAAIDAIYAAYWQRGEDVTSDAVLAAALRDVPGAAEAIAGADSAAVKGDLRRRTDEAIALGIFGAPAWIVRRDGAHTLIWGQDRLAWVEAVARGWKPDDEVYTRVAGWGSAASAPAVASERVVDFYFDVSSPFAYLGLTQLHALGARARLHPILLGGLFRAIGTADVPLFAFPPAKRAYVLAEMQRWARWYGVPFRMPTKFPQRTVTAQRMIACADPDVQLRLARAVAAALWAEDRDVEDDATLAAILAAEQLPPDLLARAKLQPAKDALTAETAAAVTAGVFGVPSYVVDGQLLWGQDRAELVAALLRR